MSERAPFDEFRIARNYSEGPVEGLTNVERRFKLYDYAEPYENTVQHIIESLDLNGNETITDIGTATGSFLFDLRIGKYSNPHRGQLHGFEPYTRQLPSGSKANIADALDINFAHGSAGAIPLPDNSTDVLTALFMFYHVPPDRQPNALTEFKRVLKPDGRCVIATSGNEGALENKLRIRELETVMSKILGVTPPPYMNEGYDTDKAAAQLPCHFDTVYHYKQRSVMVIDTDDKLEAYYDSFRSLYDQYEPPLNRQQQDVIAAESIIFNKVRAEYKEYGRYVDVIMRDFFVCSNGDITVPNPEKFQAISRSSKLGSVASKSTTYTL